MSIIRYSAFHRGVAKAANQLVTKYRQHGVIKPASGRCADCGTRKYLCYDHRDYSDVLTVEVVCNSCNQRRGAAWIPFLNIETLETIRYRELPRAGSGRRAKRHPKRKW